VSPTGPCQTPTSTTHITLIAIAVNEEDVDLIVGLSRRRADADGELGSIPIQGFLSVDFWHDFTTSGTITFEMFR
jgi:hypothetical protein